MSSHSIYDGGNHPLIQISALDSDHFLQSPSGDKSVLMEMAHSVGFTIQKDSSVQLSATQFHAQSMAGEHLFSRCFSL